MKNVKKLLKKAMVFTLAASMLVGTPLTASAAGIRGVYSISDGNETIDNETISGTGTVTNTDTNTGSGVLRDNDAAIIGIMLDRDTVYAEKGVKEKLTASVILDESLLAVDEMNTAASIREALEGKIKWKLSNADDEEGKGSKRNPATYVSIKTPEGAANRAVLELNPKKGTAKGEEVIVTASIEGSWYFEKDENGNYKRDESGKLVMKERKDKIEDYTAFATVSVKEYSEKLEFNEDKIKDKLTDGKSTDFTALLKHTVDFSDCLIRTPASANDEITWVSTNTKGATVTAAGEVTFKKAGESGEIYAVGEKGVKAVYKYEVANGTAATRVEITELNPEETPLKNTTIDIIDDDGEEYSVGVKMYAKMKDAIVSKTDSKKAANNENDFATKANGDVKTGNVEVADDDVWFKASEDKKGGVAQEALYITDTVAWTSNKPAIADVSGNTEGATITALSVGKAAITAKASSGKSAKLNVTVTATMTGLDFEVPEYLYSGQTETLVPIRTPKANKDAVVWSIEKESDGKKNPNATINAKGELKIKPMLNLSKEGYDSVEVTLTSKKKYKQVDKDGKEFEDVFTVTYPIDLVQSSVDGIYVKDGDKTIASAEVERKDDEKNTVKKINKNKNLADKADNTVAINVPKGKTFTIVAEATNGMDFEGEENTLSFKTSNAKFASIDPAKDGKTLKVTANAKGKATITVSGVTLNNNEKKAAKAISTTFVVNVVQPVKTLTMNKPAVSINEKQKSGKPADQTVALKVTLGPKGVNNKEAITWEVKKTKAQGVDIPNAEFVTAKDGKGKDLTKASASVNLSTPMVGDQFVIKASTTSGATATATVDVVTKTTAVAIASKDKLDNGAPVTFTKNKVEDKKISEEFKIYPFVNVGSKAEPDWKLTDEDGEWTDGKNVEGVTYSVNKKGIVTVDADGTVHVLNKGKVTITAKTPQGKKATLTVNVKDTSLPTVSGNEIITE